MKNHVVCLFSAIVLFSTSAFSQEHGNFAIFSTVSPIMTSDLISLFATNSTEPPYSIGVRGYISDRFGLDLAGGFLYGSGTKRDSVSGTSEAPGTRSDNATKKWTQS
jgi:hypothetical protein